MTPAELERKLTGITTADAMAALNRIRAEAVREAASEEAILNAIDSVHDMDVTLRDYARAVVKMLRATAEKINA